MISSIDLRQLRNASYLQFQKDFLAIVSRTDPAALQVEAKFNDLTAKSLELENLFKKVLANPISRELTLLDGRRDDAVNGMYYLALAYSYHFNAANKEAAEAILANFKLYGSGIGKLNYQAETATISNILNDWENKTELAQALTTLGLNAWKAELKTINEEFSTRYLDRTQEYGNATPETLKMKREETNTVYYALRDRINALDLLIETPPSPYSTLISQLNALIEQYNALISMPATPEEIPPPPQV